MLEVKNDKTKVYPCRRFNNCAQTQFDTVENQYLCKHRVNNQVLHGNHIFITDSVIDDIVWYNNVNMAEVSAVNVASDEVHKLQSGNSNQFIWNVYADTFIPSRGCKFSIYGQLPAASCIDIDIHTDISDCTSFEVDVMYNTSLFDKLTYSTGSGGSAVCTDESEGLLVHTVISSVAGSIPSERGSAELFTHNLEQLVYKVEYQQGLWNTDICTDFTMRDLHMNSVSLVDALVNTSSFDFMVSLESGIMLTNCSSQSVDTIYDAFSIMSVEILKQNILQESSCNSSQCSLSTVNNAHFCTDYSFKQQTLSHIMLSDYYGGILLSECSNPEKCGEVNQDFSILSATRRLTTETKYVRSFGFLPVQKHQYCTLAGSHQVQYTDMVEYIQKANSIVLNTTCFNYMKARVKVPSGINIYNCYLKIMISPSYASTLSLDFLFKY